MHTVKSSLIAVNLAIQEQLDRDQKPTKELTRRLAYQYGSRTTTREAIDAALEIINFDRLASLLTDSEST